LLLSHGQIKPDDDAVFDALERLVPDVQQAAKALLQELHETQISKVKQMIIECHREYELLQTATPMQAYMREQRYTLWRARLMYYDAFINRIPRRQTSLYLPSEHTLLSQL
jgi:hypothetical protein